MAALSCLFGMRLQVIHQTIHDSSNFLRLGERTFERGFVQVLEISCNRKLCLLFEQ